MCLPIVHPVSIRWFHLDTSDWKNLLPFSEAANTTAVVKEACIQNAHTSFAQTNVWGDEGVCVTAVWVTPRASAGKLSR